MEKERHFAGIANSMESADGQALQHFMSQSPWAEGGVYEQIQSDVCETPELQTNGLLILDECADEKSGSKSVGAGRQYKAAGSHNCLLVGSPGGGKTFMARAMPGILPDMSLDEALEVTKIYSVADQFPAGTAMIRHRPFRSPHHEFGSRVLEVMRQPMEDKVVTISRAKGSLTFSANFQLIAAMNPCPCGWFNDPIKPCTCAPVVVTTYQKRISGPLLDRIDTAKPHRSPARGLSKVE